MKRFLITVLLVIVGATGLISVLETDVTSLENNLSEVRYNLFSGQADAFSVTLMTGEREDPYILNGVAEELIEFGILTLYFKIPTGSFYGIPTYKLTIDDVFYEGEFQKNPFDASYVADIKTKTVDDSNIYLLVEWGSLYETLKLESKSLQWEYDWEDAFKIAVNNIDKEVIDNLIIDGTVEAEVHVQIIGNMNGLEGQYYWYVTVYGTDGSTITIVIDPLTGKVISKRSVLY